MSVGKVVVSGGEVTAGLLGARVDPVQYAFGGIDGRTITEARLLEIERRILAIEERLQDVEKGE